MLAGSGEQQGPRQTPPWSGSLRGLSPLSSSHWGLILLGPTQGHPFVLGHLLPGPPKGLPRMAHPQVSRPGLYLCHGTASIPGVGGGSQAITPSSCAAISSSHPLVRQGHWLLPPVVWPSAGGPRPATRLCVRGSQPCPIPPASCQLACLILKWTWPEPARPRSRSFPKPLLCSSPFLSPPAAPFGLAQVRPAWAVPADCSRGTGPPS